MYRFCDPLRNIPEVIVESRAAGFDEIGRAVFDMLAAAVGRITTNPAFADIPTSLTNMRAPLVLYRTTGGAYAQGKWRPRVGGALNVATAADWLTHVVRRGHAVIAGYPILHVVTRDENERPLDVWVLDVVMDWVVPDDKAFEPIRIYLGARPAYVEWDGKPRVVTGDARFVEGELPVPGTNAPVARP